MTSFRASAARPSRLILATLTVSSLAVIAAVLVRWNLFAHELTTAEARQHSGDTEQAAAAYSHLVDSWGRREPYLSALEGVDLLALNMEWADAALKQGELNKAAEAIAASVRLAAKPGRRDATDRVLSRCQALRVRLGQARILAGQLSLGMTDYLVDLDRETVVSQAVREKWNEIEARVAASEQDLSDARFFLAACDCLARSNVHRAREIGEELLDGDAKDLLMARLAARSGRYDEAIAICSRPREASSPFLDEFHQAHVLCLCRSGAYDKALALFSKIEDPSPWQDNLWGIAAIHAAHDDEGRKRFQSALDRDPACAPAMNNLGILCALDGAMPEAERWMRQALQIRETPASWGNLGWILHARGRRGAARKAYTRCLDMAPGDSHGNLYMAASLADEDRDMTRAEPYLEQCRESDPELVELFASCLTLPAARLNVDHRGLQKELARFGLLVVPSSLTGPFYSFNLSLDTEFGDTHIYSTAGDGLSLRDVHVTAVLSLRDPDGGFLFGTDVAASEMAPTKIRISRVKLNEDTYRTSSLGPTQDELNEAATNRAWAMLASRLRESFRIEPLIEDFKRRTSQKTREDQLAHLRLDDSIRW